MKWLGICCLVAFGFSLGCGGASNSQSVAVDAMEVTKLAFDTYDGNRNGELDATELNACMSLKLALRRLDTSRDGTLSQDELSARLNSYASATRLPRPLLFVTRRGQPIEQATIVLQPETFMGEELQAYAGKTDRYGSAVPLGENDSSQDVSPGFYQVKITAADGSETLRGCEIARDLPDMQRLTFNLQ